jgi:glutamyl-Q tRNA(Asp) synthetase
MSLPDTPPVRGRFAPSPTGPLHLGSLVAALGSWMMARSQGGEWLVRVEDLDPPREVPGAADAQLRALDAFGLRSDGPVWRQSLRGDRYGEVLESLRANDLAFTCRCSRSELVGAGGIHRRCGPAPSDRPAAIRLRVPDREEGFIDQVQGPFAQNLGREVGDFVLRRADGLWAYQLAVVVDDADQGITQVVRGADLLDSTPRQIFLQRLLGFASPGYSHLPLVLGEDGAKLAKSIGSLPLDERAPWPALQAAWRFLGQDPQVLVPAADPETALQAALPHFRPEAIARVHGAALPAAPETR